MRFKRFLLIFFFCVPFLVSQTQFLSLSTGQKIFASGMNLAWIDFDKDLVDFDEAEFARALDDVSRAGGNTLRWWLHINGNVSPIFQGDSVIGLNPQEIPNLKKALDLAYERKMIVLPVLWSFDMLQNNMGDRMNRNKRFLENPALIQTYIDNALVPMVRALKGHPALLAWEIINEPEGMSTKWGWTPVKVSMQTIQRFHNLLAGAIHREDPNAQVCNGCWNIMALSDQGDFHNYYSDAELIAAGGDSLGTLDFYQVHYYPRWYGEAYSPFHHPASFWQLDKPLLIGEFQAKGFDQLEENSRLTSTMTTEKAYLYAMENGYAGALAWTWTGHDGFGDVQDATPGMIRLKRDYPEVIVIN